MTHAEAECLSAGDRLAHFRIETRVGEGAMGTVFRAHDTSLDRTVGLKVLKPGVAEDGRFVRRFVREARAAARVSHPHLAHIYFIGEQDGRHFFAMEFVEGRDLESHVAEDGPLPLDVALDVLVQAARGLRAAHEAGVIHRDVKPSNILRQADGMVRITDFGLAKSLDVDVDATQGGVILGTPTYMSPEQCRGTSVDRRCDIYALGLTAWYLLAGRRPYATETLGALINDQINTPLPPVSAHRPDLPEEVDRALRAMCAKDPAERFPDMDAVIEALEACRPRPVHLATLAPRLGAALLDLLLVFVAVSAVHFVVHRLLGGPDLLLHALGRVLLGICFAAYHLVGELRWGRTLGKALFQLQVVDDDGTGVRRAVLPLRFVLRYPALALGALGLPELHPVVDWAADGLQGAAVAAAALAYFLARRRTLSDLLTRTRVVYRMPPADRETNRHP